MALPKDFNTDITEAILSAVPDPFFIFDETGRYIQVLGGIDRQKYHDGQHLIGMRLHDAMPTELADQFLLQINKAIEAEKVITYVYLLSAKDIKGSENLEGPSGQQWFKANISPIKAIKGQPRMVVWAAFNITELHNTLTEKEALIVELKEAISEIKVLRGILPICSYCKKIRDDKGYWNQVESYIHRHTGVEFSHGICKDCADKYYRDMNLFDD
jgi:PAS domain-containing protein